jgi:hypothetical protein
VRGLRLSAGISNDGGTHPAIALDSGEDHVAPLRRWSLVGSSLGAEAAALPLVKLATDVGGVRLNLATQRAR